jgi:2-polyprenyl-3-methyl-5-hydroxy-6-metoxy-1,4-benzoquinol methylase
VHPERHSIGDRSNGYEGLASEYMLRRERAGVGVAAVREWARTLGPGSVVLDLGCGHGVPLARALINDGLAVHAIDASPTMVAAFRQRFPDAPVICEAVEESSFFNRSFDGVLAWGLLFLLPEEAQRGLIRRVASALNRGGKFLFTCPSQRCTWADALTGRESRSLGAEAYGSLLSEAGLLLAGTRTDEGDNHYYEATRL